MTYLRNRPLLPLISFITISCLGLVSGLRVKVIPGYIEELVTDLATVTCDVKDNPEWASNIELVELGMEGQEPFATMSKDKLEVDVQNNLNIKADGHLDEKDATESYLRLSIRNPGTEVGGVYVCRLYYVDGFGVFKDKKAYANMTVDSSYVGMKKGEQTTDEYTMELLKNLTEKVSSLEKTVKDQDTQLQSQKKLMEKENQKVSAQISAVSHQEQTNTKSIQGLKEKASFVSAFSAAYDGKVKMKEGQAIRFGDILFNIGKNYNAATGVFTAPKQGIYGFNVAMKTDKRGRHVDINLVVNGVVMATVYALDEKYYDQGAVSTILSLQAGDEVKTVVKYVTDHVTVSPSKNRYSLFSGYLIQQV